MCRECWHEGLPISLALNLVQWPSVLVSTVPNSAGRAEWKWGGDTFRQEKGGEGWFTFPGGSRDEEVASSMSEPSSLAWKPYIGYLDLHQLAFGCHRSE